MLECSYRCREPKIRQHQEQDEKTGLRWGYFETFADRAQNMGIWI